MDEICGPIYTLLAYLPHILVKTTINSTTEKIRQKVFGTKTTKINRLLKIILNKSKKKKKKKKNAWALKKKISETFLNFLEPE